MHANPFLEFGRAALETRWAVLLAVWLSIPITRGAVCLSIETHLHASFTRFRYKCFCTHGL